MVGSVTLKHTSGITTTTIGTTRYYETPCGTTSYEWYYEILRYTTSIERYYEVLQVVLRVTKRKCE